MSNGNTETDEETGSNEHGDVGTNGLQDNTNDHDDTSGDNTGTSTKDIGNVRSDGKSDNRTDRHDGVEQTSS